MWSPETLKVLNEKREQRERDEVAEQELEFENARKMQEQRKD